MGYASDMQDLFTSLAGIIKGTNSSWTVGQLKDYIAYSEEGRSIRIYLCGIDPEYVIEPHTKLIVEEEYNEGDGQWDELVGARVLNEHGNVLAQLDKEALVEHDIQDAEDVLAWYYDQYMRGN